MNKIFDFTPKEWDALKWAIDYTTEQWLDHPDWNDEDDPVMKERVAAYDQLVAIRERMD
jgi:hypothetical protein